MISRRNFVIVGFNATFGCVFVAAVGASPGEPAVVPKDMDASSGPSQEPRNPSGHGGDDKPSPPRGGKAYERPLEYQKPQQLTSPSSQRTSRYGLWNDDERKSKMGELEEGVTRLRDELKQIEHDIQQACWRATYPFRTVPTIVCLAVAESTAAVAGLVLPADPFTRFVVAAGVGAKAFESCDAIWKQSDTYDIGSEVLKERCGLDMWDRAGAADAIIQGGYSALDAGRSYPGQANPRP